MKTVLVTGVNSYLGKYFKKYFRQFGDDYEILSVSMKDGSWRSYPLDGIDVIYHVAGIAHSDSGRISRADELRYYDVNTDLTIELAKKAKREGVKQFIFMSSAIVYGDSAPIGQTKRITADTRPIPANCYGDSKLQAENGLRQLDCESFKVVILRPPMIYGAYCKGNYQSLAKLVRHSELFPRVKNERSMLYVENLMEFIHLMIENEERGLFFPQNREYVSTSKMAYLIAQANGRKLKMTGAFNLALKLLSGFIPKINKAFGNLSYDMSMSEYDRGEYRLYSLEESIYRTENRT